ncbi:MAG: glucuronate isomerase [Eubacteriales bacterium]|nr:glucuronate isomerase [Eubacteriales bacterium]MDD3883158.1 glucuronate isomerase [Eubacteriales bacterium]MDD4512459.1 glucuronate isomerase [Eubacteriales bacterium]
MKEFMDEDFLLGNETAKELYHGAAEGMPIIDYHCHLSPKEIAEDIQFRNITHLMLGGDHYKWRMMLSAGVDETLIRGNGDDREKFRAFATALKSAIGNPLYHWTHLELKRVFGINEILSDKTCDEIFDKASAMLQTKEFSAKRLIEKFGVKLICTTDDPIDSLEWHDKIREDKSFSCRVLPAFRPDKAINIERAGFADYIGKLSAASGIRIANAADVAAALASRIDYFNRKGARLSDHALDTVPYAKPEENVANAAFAAMMSGNMPTDEMVSAYKTYILVAVGKKYASLNWTQQYHIGAMRNNNERIFKTYGADVGFDSIIDEPFAYNLSRLMNEQDKEGLLPRTILYTLNPAANYAVGTMLGNFQQSGVPGKIQFGSGWWFCDQRDGMERQIRDLAALGLLSRFVGMLTDSRSFISYPRHEYFRRILCNLLGTWVENGEYPADMETLKEIVKDISYRNAERYFGM